MNAKPTIKTTCRFGPVGGGSYVDRVKERWTKGTPDWVLVLAQTADAYAAQNKGTAALGTFLGCSAAVLTAIIGKTYQGRYDHIEQLVRGKLMSQTVMCETLGMTIARDQCANNQKRKPSSANPLTAKFPAACRACSHFGGQNA